MAPSEFFVQLQHGIKGGFAPPTPSAVHSLVRSKDAPSHIVVNSAVRQDGQPSFGEAQSKNLSVETYSPLIDELESILSSIPVESPPGSEDIYEMDIGLRYGSENLQWANGGPAGCGIGNSMTKATEEDKMRFKRAVEIVNQLIDEKM